jgi:secreted trypsin-like serine protease
MTGVPHETCQAAYSKFDLLSSQLCAEGDAGSDACTGDSGGPLVTTVDVRVFLVRVISFGVNSCDTLVKHVRGSILQY